MTDIKYKFDEIKLNDKYQSKLNDVLKNSWLSKDLYDSGFYEYQYKLHQYLSECGLNRTTQLYGTCWFNVVLNSCIFGDNFRGRIIQLLDSYEKKFGKDKLLKIVDKINKTEIKLKTSAIQKQKLTASIDNIEYNIFEHIIAIFYKILCQDGLRNSNKNLYDNFNLTNLAISIKSVAIKKPIDPKKLDEIAYMSLEGIDIMTTILNKFLDSNYHLMYNKNNYGEYEYILNNPVHINMITIMLNDDNKKSSSFFSFYYDLTIKNLALDINDNGIKDYIVFEKLKNSVNLKTMSNVDFIILNYEYKNVDKIPKEFMCIVNGKKYLFKLDVAIIDVLMEGTEIGHVVTGMMCNNKYYVYDSGNNFYSNAIGQI
jgi:hypothetical protein